MTNTMINDIIDYLCNWW